MDKYSHADLASGIGQLGQVVRRMEPCDRVAKLVGLVLRVQWALAQGADLKAPLHDLAVATERGLHDDPWMQLSCLVQHLKSGIDALDDNSAGTHAVPDPDQPGLVREDSHLS